MRQRIVLEGELEAGWGGDALATPYVQFGNRTGLDPLEDWIVGEMEWDIDRCLDGQWVRITIEAIERPETAAVAS
jgi:hypothetical protein